MLFGDPALDEAVGKRRPERFDAAVRLQIGVEHDDVGVSFGDFDKLVAVRSNETLRPRRRGCGRQLLLGEHKARRPSTPLGTALSHVEGRAHALEPFVDARQQFGDGGAVVFPRRRAGVEAVRLGTG